MNEKMSQNRYKNRPKNELVREHSKNLNFDSQNTHQNLPHRSRCLGVSEQWGITIALICMLVL